MKMTNRQFHRTWVISANGNRAWKWSDPQTVRQFANAAEVDAWKSEALKSGLIVKDDRNAPAGNVWD
jgi:hypothetical protein